MNEAVGAPLNNLKKIGRDDDILAILRCGHKVAGAEIEGRVTHIVFSLLLWYRLKIWYWSWRATPVTDINIDSPFIHGSRYMFRR